MSDFPRRSGTVGSGVSARESGADLVASAAAMGLVGAAWVPAVAAAAAAGAPCICSWLVLSDFFATGGAGLGLVATGGGDAMGTGDVAPRGRPVAAAIPAGGWGAEGERERGATSGLLGLGESAGGGERPRVGEAARGSLDAWPVVAVKPAATSVVTDILITGASCTAAGLSM